MRCCSRRLNSGSATTARTSSRRASSVLSILLALIVSVGDDSENSGAIGSRFGNELPHCGQKRASDLFSKPHCGQKIFVAVGRLWPAPRCGQNMASTRQMHKIDFMDMPPDFIHQH